MKDCRNQDSRHVAAASATVILACMFIIASLFQQITGPSHDGYHIDSSPYARTT